MSKQWRYFLFVLLLIVPLTLAACGGDDDDNGGDNGDNGSSDVGDLNQTFESEMGLSFDYPEGWAATEDGGQAYLANSQDVLDKMESGSSSEAAPGEGEVGMIISAISLADIGMDPENTSLDDAFGMMTGLMTGEGMSTRGDVETITIDGTDARLQRISDSETSSDGFLIVFMRDDSLAMMVGLTAEGQADQYESVAQDIAATISFTPPAGDAE